MNYNLLKEVQPEETVEYIKKILKTVNIELNEDIVKYEKNNIYNPCSIQVSVNGNKTYSTNGKGTSLVNAKASAYAEFMERLQSQFIFPFNNQNYIYSPDEKIVDDVCLFNNLISQYVQDNELLLLLNLLANSIADDKLSKMNKSVLVPFYSYKTNGIVDLPVYIISLLQGSTGISAGNTIEEALVQGLSEICERFAQAKIINENLSIPNIPSDNYMKYEKLAGMIKILEENGYSVLIKDASLGLDLPVICAVIYNHDKDTVSIRFGAHPSFPIAVERCLTEFAQGWDITAKNKHIPFETFVSECALKYTIEENNLNFLNEKIQKCNVFIENCDYIQEQFYRRKPSYTLAEHAWISTDDKVNNEYLLKFLLKNIKKYTDEIFIRDVSFLGFPSVIISIPEMSFILDNNKERIKYKLELQNYIEEGMPESEDSVDFLFKALASQGPPIFYRNYKASYKFPNENLLLLCAIILRDYKNIKKYSDCIIKNKQSYEVYKKEFISNIILTNLFFDMKSKNLEDEEILKILYQKFSKDEVNKFLLFIKFLSFDRIRNMIIGKSSNNENECENNKANCDGIINELIKKQEQHIIDQKKLSRVFYGVS